LRSELATAGIRLDYRHCATEIGLLGQFSLPAILCGAMVVPVNWLCSAMLVRTPGGYAEMGIYNAMNHWFVALLFLPTVLEQVTLPMISERLGANDHRQSRKLLRLSLKTNALIVVPLIVVGSCLSPLVVRLYGRGFEHSARVLIVVLLTAGFYAMAAPAGQLLIASNRLWLGFGMNAVWAAAMIVFTRLLLDRGAQGLANARLFAYLVHSVWTVLFVYKLANQENPPVIARS